MKTRPVDVYFNIHKQKLSIRSRSKKRRVIAHRSAVLMKDCRFVVSEAGRQRVLRDRRKNVHAVVRGEWVEIFNWGEGLWRTNNFFPNIELDRWRLVKYNPYRNSQFVDVETGEPVLKADYVLINGKDILAI